MRSKKSANMSRIMALLDSRRQWIDMKSKVHAVNIAKVDIPGAVKNDVTPFKKFFSDYAKQRATGKSGSMPTHKYIYKTNTYAKKDEEMIAVQRNAAEHMAVIQTISTLHKMMKSSLSTGSN